MRWSDLLSAALENLLRRKLRSLLTMLGVVIGTAAIVVTVSLGYGAEAAQMQALESATNLRLIQVYPHYGYGSGSGETSSGRRVSEINDRVLADIRKMSGVAAVTPIVNVWASVSFQLTTGKYQAYTSLTGVLPEDFAKITELKSGSYFTGATDRMEFIMSEIMLMEFRRPKDEAQYVDFYTILKEGGELPLPKINWYSAKYELTMSWEDYSKFEQTGASETVTRDYRAKLNGIIAANLNDWTFANGAVVNLNWLRRFYRENKDVLADVGFPDLNKFDNVYVLADSVNSVEDLTKALNDYGLQYYSPMQTVAAMKEQIATVQGFLGFIGAISMMVAALSIANTMMMSIYERTREIGIMKVLGCRLANIRMLFLAEAAYIGFFGGGLGLAVSYALSYALNNVAWLQGLVGSIMQGSSFFTVSGGSASLIPPALAWGTWLFVVVISLCSGIYPAYRAMRLSSLAAIRGE